MELHPQQATNLKDRQERNLGRVIIDRIAGDLVFGRFAPGPDYGGVQHLFAEYVQAANEQLLSIVGELDTTIASLGLHLQAPEGARLPAIYDVQIGDGIITFRVRSDGRDGVQQHQTATPAVPSRIIDSDVRSAGTEP